MSDSSIYKGTKEQKELDELGSNIYLLAIVLSTCVCAVTFGLLICGTHFKWFEWGFIAFFFFHGPWQMFIGGGC